MIVFVFEQQSGLTCARCRAAAASSALNIHVHTKVAAEQEETAWTRSVMKLQDDATWRKSQVQPE